MSQCQCLDCRAMTSIHFRRALTGLGDYSHQLSVFHTVGVLAVTSLFSACLMPLSRTIGCAMTDAKLVGKVFNKKPSPVCVQSDECACVI
jgi:hypothetical protein